MRNGPLLMKYSYAKLAFLISFCPLLLKGQERRKYITFIPQISLASFSAEQTKIVGPIVSGELALHFNKVDYPRNWMKQLGVRSVDFAFTYQNTEHAKAVLKEIAYPIGNSYGLTAGLSFSLYHSKTSALYFSAATGLGYFAKAGPINQHIILGSKINYSSKFQLSAEKALSLNSRIIALIGFYHLSNGGIRIPNNGLNVSSVGLGFSYDLKSKINNNSANDMPIAESYKRHSFDLGLTIGATGMLNKNKLLYKTDLYAGYNYRMSSMLGLSFGADAIYNFTTYDIDHHYETYQGYASSPSHWRLGVGVGPDVWLGRFVISPKLGRYLLIKTSNERKLTHFYSTIGFKYHFTNWFAAQTKVHLHRTEAEFVGFGVIFNR